MGGGGGGIYGWVVYVVVVCLFVRLFVFWRMEGGGVCFELFSLLYEICLRYMPSKRWSTADKYNNNNNSNKCLFRRFMKRTMSFSEYKE